MPRRHIASLLNRWGPVACAALALMAAHCPASAVTFTLVSDGSGHYLNLFWEGCVWSCITHSPPCTQVSSVNGRIPLTITSTIPPGFYPTHMEGGMLDWTGQSGSLQVVALTAVRAASASTPPYNCSGAWAAVDARTTPLVFAITPEVGDPFPLAVDLQVLPKLLGTIEQFTDPGGVATLYLQMQMSVAVDGQQVSRDSLYGEFPVSDGADVTWQPAFPNGASNYAYVPGVTAGSEVTISIWAYTRAYCLDSSSIRASSPYGEGPAIEILVRDANTVAVPEESRPDELRLAARPNPSPGTARILYALPRTSAVRLSVYDVAGHRVATLVDRIQEAGRRELVWNGRNARGEPLGPGVYLMELLTGAERTVGKLVILGR